MSRILHSYRSFSKMQMNPELFTYMAKPVDSVIRFFEGPLSNLGWSKGNEEVVLDVGCGPGWFSPKLILPLLPNLEKLYAVDLQPDMINYAIAHNSHPKIDYSVANIEDWSSVKKWEGQISKLFCINCLQWVKEQKLSIHHIWRLLKPNGHAAFFMFLQSTLYQANLELIKDPKWSHYFRGVDTHISEAHIKNYDASHYTQMLEEAGFTITYCNQGVRLDRFPSDDVLTTFFLSLCVLVPHIPVDRREEFKDNFRHIFLEINDRDGDGFPRHRGTAMELVIQKT